MIHKYGKNIFTHEGQSTVNEFGQEIMANRDEIAAVRGLIVYAGYHGDDQGNWDHDFDAAEIETTKEVADLFPNAVIKWVSKPGLTDEEIRAAYDKGNVFFTWCDSDIKIRTLIG